MAPTRDEFTKLALEQLDALDRFARSLTRSVDSDDLVQETLLRAIKSQHTFDLRSHGIRPWLFRICHNVFLTRGKRESGQPRAVEQETLQSFAAPIIQWEESIENSELNLAMSQLSPELASVLTLWAVDDLSYREIAEVLDVPIGTVMSRLHRARSKLAGLLDRPDRSELTPDPSTNVQATQGE